jgi:hypothetical protein
MREDKICPIMRAAMMSATREIGRSVTYCIGQECAWHDHCYPDNEELKRRGEAFDRLVNSGKI